MSRVFIYLFIYLSQWHDGKVDANLRGNFILSFVMEQVGSLDVNLEIFLILFFIIVDVGNVKNILDRTTIINGN